MTTAEPARPIGPTHWRDPRAWVGVALTAVFVGFALRGVDFERVASEFARADWLLLLGISLPGFAGLVWLRALRWKELTDPVGDFPVASLIRALLVGYATNNVLPLRLGDLARAWYLERETGGSAAAILGTIMLERVIDTLCLLGMAVVALTLAGSAPDDPLAAGAIVLLPATSLLILGLVVLRLWPDFVIGVARAVLRPFPERLSTLVIRLLESFVAGLGALRRGRHLVRICAYSAGIWLLFSSSTIAAGILALHIDLGDPLRWLAAVWTAQAAIGIAVALPSAPGFFGVFHYACRLALVRFGVPLDTAIAAGTLIHSLMWIVLTVPGLWLLRRRHTTLGELDAAVDEVPPAQG